MDALIIYDDRAPMCEQGRNFIGVDRYSQLIHCKRTLAEGLLTQLRSWGFTKVRILENNHDLDQLLSDREASGPADLTIYLPSSIAWRDAEVAGLFLRKLMHVRESFVIPFEGDGEYPILICGRREGELLLGRLRRADWGGLLEEHGSRFRSVEEATAGVMSLRSHDNLVEFVSSTFDVRHFNAIRHDASTITKRSTDRDKMRRERKLFELLPPHLRLYFLPPLDHGEDPDSAWYTIERLSVPDMAIQWIHGVISGRVFDHFLGRIREFLRARPTRPGTTEEAERCYLGKCERRLGQLSDVAGYHDIAAVYRCAARGNIEDLLERLRAQWRRLTPRRADWSWSVSHGDLCFSNILYGRQNRVLKFIDPRGADGEEEIYLDAYYDVAKLSHSICGSYDFINHDLCDLRFGCDLRLKLEVHDQRQAIPTLRAAFISAMAEDGYDPDLIRLYEASLFLSMLPLHADVPKKVVAFALTAERLIGTLEDAP